MFAVCEVISAAGALGVTVVSPTVHVRVCTYRGPLNPESVALLPVDGLRTQSIPSGPTGSRTSACTTVPGARFSGSRSRLRRLPVLAITGPVGPPVRHVTFTSWKRGCPVSTHTTESRATVPAGVFLTTIWPELRMPVTRATMFSRPIWSKSKPIQRIIECSLGRFWPHGYPPPPSWVPILPPEMLSSPSQRHHFVWLVSICAAVWIVWWKLPGSSPV